MARQLFAVLLVALMSAGYAGAGTATYKIRLVSEAPVEGKDKEKAKPRAVAEVTQRAPVGRWALYRLTSAPLPTGSGIVMPDVEVQAVTIRTKDGYRVGARLVVPGPTDQDPPYTLKPLKAGETIRLPVDAKQHLVAEVTANVEPGLVDRQPNLVASLLKVLGRGEPETEKSAFNALTALGADAVPGLLEGIQSDNKLVQNYALRALSAIVVYDQLPGDEVVPPVLKLVNGPDRDLRSVALGTLTELGRRNRTVARDLVPTLVRLLEDPDETIRRNAAASLELIVQKGE